MSQSKATRREFLIGKSALKAAADLLPVPSPAPSTEAARELLTNRDEGAYLMHISRRAMACDFQILLNAGQHPKGPAIALEALELVDTLEDQLSVHRDHSELSRINQHAADRPIVVERRLFALLQQSVDLYHATEGAFDITAGPLSRVWGFHRRQGQWPAEGELRAALERVGSRWIQLEATDSTIRFLRPGVELNLGSIGKGYALDRCAELLVRRDVDNFLVHGGQSSILARGDRHRASGEKGWCVALRHPLKPEVRLAELRLCNRSLGTSGSGHQFFYFRGRRYGHVLDPRTGLSVEGVLSATALAPTGAEADALATAFFVLGVDKTGEFCEQHPDLAALLVTPGDRAGSLLLYAFNLDDADWTPDAFCQQSAGIERERA